MIIATLAIGPDFRKKLAAALKTKADYAAKHGYTYVQGGRGGLGPDEAHSVVEGGLCSWAAGADPRGRTRLSFRRGCCDYEPGAAPGGSRGADAACWKGSAHDHRRVRASELWQYAHAEYAVDAGLVAAGGGSRRTSPITFGGRMRR